MNVQIVNNGDKPINHAKVHELSRCIGNLAKATHQAISDTTSLPNELVGVILAMNTGANPKDLQSLIQQNNTASPATSSYPMNNSLNISMPILGGFMAVVGCAAVATAFALLNAETFGMVGLVVAPEPLAGIGAASILAGVGLFAGGTYRNRQATPSESLVNSGILASQPV